ncbi:MAG: hypothetical protein RL154_1523, partial [Pseudomonadota bacterium]
MNYKNWLLSPEVKHKAVVEKLLLQGSNTDEIIDYFEYENMQ